MLEKTIQQQQANIFMSVYMSNRRDGILRFENLDRFKANKF